MKHFTTDVLVIGAGLSGLMAAWRARTAGADVLVASPGGGASGWLQGVNVALGHEDSRDSIAAHVEDLRREGSWINDPDIVTDTVENAVPAFLELVRIGVDFANDGGCYRQRLASGSQYPRCCYVSGMMWGPKASRVLHQSLKHEGAGFERISVLRLLVVDNRAYGAVGIMTRTGEPVILRAGATILASGGVGGLFQRSTYPRDVSGASYALMARAGARMKDMEFIQFEPLVGLQPDPIRGYVIPTTLFGDGAVLRDRNGVRFIPEWRRAGEPGIGKEELVRILAAVAEQGRCTDTGGLLLDVTDVGDAKLASYPWLTRFMQKHGVDMRRDRVEIWPAAHTCLGGAVVDRNRETSIHGLFAVGEAAGGIHGAGRLAGGSGTDVIASGYIGGARAADAALAGSTLPKIDPVKDGLGATLASRLEEMAQGSDHLSTISHRVSEILTASAGIKRNGHDLAAGLENLIAIGNRLDESTLQATEWPVELAGDKLIVAGMIVAAALRRQESRGAHLRSDFPDEDKAAAQSWVIDTDAGISATHVLRILVGKAS